MKKTLIALAVLGSVAGVAQAQSAVTVYGKVDLGITKLSGDVSDAAKPTTMQGNHGSRIGFKGAEDLGGGLSAIFQVENRFDADTGAQHGVLFNGPVFVGLTGGFGAVKLGRNWSTVDSASSSAIDPFEGDGISGLNEFTRARINNSITYYSPAMSGFEVQAQYILGEKPAAAVASGTDNDGYAVAATYNNGPIYLGASYGVEDNLNKKNIWAVTGSYAFGPAKVLLGYDQVDTKVPGAAKIKNFVIGATYAAGSGLIKAAYGQTKDGFDNFAISGFSGNSYEKIQKFSIGYQHNLSKRTSLYADVAHTKVTNPGSDTENGVGVGITHSF
ncbi:MAG: porin [Burkholderiaceae bacterium]